MVMVFTACSPQPATTALATSASALRTPSVAPSALVPTLEFDDPSLPAGTRATWKDGLRDDSAWTVVASGEQSGDWKYATKDLKCSAEVAQSHDVPVGAVDDRQASEDLVASMARNESGSAQGQMIRGAFGYVNAGRNAIANMGLIYDAPDGHAVVLMARIFREAGLSFTARVDCATLQDVWSTGGEAVTKTAIVVL